MWRSIYACKSSSLWTVNPLNINIPMKRICGILLFVAMWLLMESGDPSSWCIDRFAMKVDCPFNPCMVVLILYASPFPLLCGCMNPHQRWHLSFVGMAVGSFFSPLQSSVIFISMSKWWLLLVHLWNTNGDDGRHLSNKNLVCVDVSP